MLLAGRDFGLLGTSVNKEGKREHAVCLGHASLNWWLSSPYNGETRAVGRHDQETQPGFIVVLEAVGPAPPRATAQGPGCWSEPSILALRKADIVARSQGLRADLLVMKG